MLIQSIKKQNVSEEVFAQMKDMLISGQWKPGDKIPSENELTDMFGVSRVTIREVLKKLHSYDVVESIQGKGTFVKCLGAQGIINPMFMSVYLKSMDERAIRDMMEFRGLIETESIALAAARATDEDLKVLRQNYKRMVASRDNLDTFAKYDIEFHIHISKMTKNVILIELSSVIWEFMREHFNTVVSKVGADKGIYHHGRLIEELIKKDPISAKAAMSEHLDDTYKGFFADENDDYSH